MILETKNSSINNQKLPYTHIYSKRKNKLKGKKKRCKRLQQTIGDYSRDIGDYTIH